MKKEEIFIGVDVSKLTLDLAVYGSKNHIRISNDSEGFKQMQAQLCHHKKQMPVSKKIKRI